MTADTLGMFVEAPEAQMSTRNRTACSAALGLAFTGALVWSLGSFTMGCAPAEQGQAVLNAAGSSSRDGVFMYIGSNLTNENLQLMKAAGFGVIFFQLGDANGVRWEAERGSSAEWSREEVKTLLQPARSMGFRVVPWIEKIWLANTASSVVVEHLKESGLSDLQIAQPACQVEGFLSYLNISDPRVRKGIIDKAVLPLADLSKELGSGRIHVDDLLRLSGKSGCDGDKQEAIYSFASEIKTAVSAKGVAIDFSHLDLEYSRRQFNTDWTRFGFDKSLTTVQAYVKSKFDADYARVKSLGVGGVIINASIYNSGAPGKTYTSLDDALALIKRVRADGKVAHVFSFQSIKDAEQMFNKPDSVRWFFSQLAAAPSQTAYSGELPAAVGGDGQETEPVCGDITAEGRKLIESCFQSATMQTLSESNELSYFPVFEEYPAGGSVSPFRYGFSKGFPVRRVLTCFDASSGRHYSKVKTERATASFPEVGAEFWIALQHLKCR